jgi:hypothetical protein
MPKAQIKDGKPRRKLLNRGESKAKSPRVAAAATAGAKRGGGKSRSYDNWTKTDLIKRAREVGIKGRSMMNKTELITALRNR